MGQVQNFQTPGAGGPIAVTEADGANVTLGAIADAAVATDSAGTVNAHERGIVKLLASCISIVSGWMAVSIQNATLAVTQSGSWVLSAGSAIIGKVGIDQTTPGTTNLVAAGGVGAAGAAVAGNPTRNGGLGRTTTPTTVASAQLVDLLLDRFGRTFKIAPVCTIACSAGTPITTNANTLGIAAPAAGNHLRIHKINIQNGGPAATVAAATQAYLTEGSGGTKKRAIYLLNGQPYAENVEGRWELPTATGLYINTVTTGCNVEWSFDYEVLAD